MRWFDHFFRGKTNKSNSFTPSYTEPSHTENEEEEANLKEMAESRFVQFQTIVCNTWNEVIQQLQLVKNDIVKMFPSEALVNVGKLLTEVGIQLTDLAGKAKAEAERIVMTEEFAKKLCLVLGIVGIGISAVVTLGAPLVIAVAITIGVALVTAGTKALVEYIAQNKSDLSDEKKQGMDNRHS